jgi:hypothetical protein
MLTDRRPAHVIAVLLFVGCAAWWKLAVTAPIPTATATACLIVVGLIVGRIREVREDRAQAARHYVARPR